MTLTMSTEGKRSSQLLRCHRHHRSGQAGNELLGKQRMEQRLQIGATERNWMAIAQAKAEQFSSISNDGNSNLGY